MDLPYHRGVGWTAEALQGMTAASLLVCGCGPSGSGADAAGSAGTANVTPGTTSNASASGGASPTPGASTNATTGMDTAVDTTGDTASTTVADSTDSGPPPGADCERPPPPVDLPSPPPGCETVWLVDADGAVIEGAASGFVRCPGPETEVVYRTAAVACPALVGDTCLCDADCDPGHACICANEITTATGLGQPAGNRCFPTDCASETDCNGSMCRVDVGPCLGAWFPQALRCSSPSDDCVFDAECAGFCDYDERTEMFTCEPGGICE